ncbi:lipopolysaccharide assembly protein LapB [uncultured Enorma sp.]|uniref:tetratricopeptide repeat protein n=1 Tax=uncultured Enorma sp. TaxID=1714346 RepID=UPI00260B79EA|nr:hypothetical protein [uncultured Enorma sp.]
MADTAPHKRSTHEQSHADKREADIAGTPSSALSSEANAARPSEGRADVSLHERDAGTSVDFSQTPLEKELQPLEPLSRLPLPDAIEAVRLSCEAAEHPSGIERYIVRVLSEVDDARLRAIVMSHRMALAFITRMDAFYLNFDPAGVSERDRSFLYDVEAALNRIYRVLVALGFGMRPVTSSPSEEACSVYEQAAYANVTSWVERILADAGEENPWARLATVSCAPGGVWDVLTRFATLSEQLGLIVRLDYNVQLEQEGRELCIRFDAPTWPGMPATYFDLEEGAWHACVEDERTSQALEYAARITLVLAAAGFASGLAIERCVVEARDLESGSVHTVLLERERFMAELSTFASELEGRSLSEPLARRALTAFRAADEADRGALRTDDTHDAAEGERRVDEAERVRHRAPEDDRRALSPMLRDLLLADTAHDLAVMESEDDPYMQRLNALHAQEDVDFADAERGYIALLDELEAQCATRELLSEGPVITRFCESYVGRIELPVFEEDPTVRILRAPDALFFARLALGRMYADAGAYERALDEARKLLDSAPTSMQAHATLVNILAHLERYDEVVEVARHGLRVAFERESIAYLLYRAAFAHWRLGDFEAAAACYRLVRGAGKTDALAEQELRMLLEEVGRNEPPTIEEALACLRSRGMVCAPWSDGFRRIVDAAVLLADNGFYFLAGRCVHAMWHVLGRDELGVVSRALLG